MKKSNELINIHNASVTYKNGHIGLLNASCKIFSSSITGLVGINGAGKSTLFKAIMGFVPLSSGKISVFDYSVEQALKSCMIAYVPQSEEIDWSFPVLVEDVVMMGRYGHMNFFRNPKKTDIEIVDLSLNQVGMIEYKKRQIGELSGGQRKRVFLARALAQNGKIILLDEPFTGIDVKTENKIIELLQALRDEGHIILVSTHNLGSVPEFCDQTILVNKTVLAYGPTHTTFTQVNLEKAFGGVLRHFVLSGSDLHDDEDKRKLRVITDDEKPFVIYDDK